MRMILGLDAPTRGPGHGRRPAATATCRRRCSASARCWRRASIHPGRSAPNHLLALAQTHGIPRRRVDEVIDLVGLQPGRPQARRQRSRSAWASGSGIAAALLGDPATLVLDEPVNGLDPEGIHWIRNLLRGLAAEGRTVFVSSHLMSEMALTADHLIVIGRGRLLADMPMADFIAQASPAVVRVRSPHATPLRELLLGDGVTVSSDEPGVLEVAGLSTEAIGDRAAADGLTLHELSPRHASLEDAFMELTRDAVEYEAGGMTAVTQARVAASRVDQAALAAVHPDHAARRARPRGRARRARAVAERRRTGSDRDADRRLRRRRAQPRRHLPRPARVRRARRDGQSPASTRPGRSGRRSPPCRSGCRCCGRSSACSSRSRCVLGTSRACWRSSPARRSSPPRTSTPRSATRTSRARCSAAGSS